MLLSLLCVALPLIALGIPPACASDLSGRSWEDCLKAPDRDCVLNEAMNQVYLLDRTDRRAALVAAVSETLAKAGEIDQATQLSTQIPDRLLARIAVEREIAVAQARALHHKEAEAAFDRALQLAYVSKDALERAEALYSIADSQANAGMKSAADLTFDQALQAAATVRIVGQKGRVVMPTPETKLAELLQKLAMRYAKADDIAQALQIARSIPYDHNTRARTLLAIADLQMRAGAAPEATLDDALAAEHDARSEMVEWPSFRDSGLAVKAGSAFGNVGLLCEIAGAQARAGLAAKASASFEQAVLAAQSSPAVDLHDQSLSVAMSLADVASAQAQAGLNAAARATLARAITAEEAIVDQRLRAAALVRVVEVQLKMANAAQDPFMPALSIARALPNKRLRALTLQRIATSEAAAGLGDEAAPVFTEAVGLASQDGDALSNIADGQRRAGLIRDAAATFEAALTASMAGEDRNKPFKLTSMIHLIADNGRGRAMMAASPSLGIRLLEAAQAITEGLDRAEILAVIARSLPD
jgi:tetratricopeptide (TPR) repeat protein